MKLGLLTFSSLQKPASEASHVCYRANPNASEASHPRERSDREPPAGLASRPGAAGAEGRIASNIIKPKDLKIMKSDLQESTKEILKGTKKLNFY